MMKQLLFVLCIFLVLPLVFANHDLFDAVKNWDDAKLDSWKAENPCNCYKGILQTEKAKNPDIDKLGVAKICTNACIHCENPKESRLKGNAECVRQCLTLGPIRTETQISSCLDSCVRGNCENKINVTYTQIKQQISQLPASEPAKEEKPPEPEAPPTPPPPSKQEVVEVQPMSTEECSLMAKKTAARLGKEAFCDSQFSLITFSSEIQKTVDQEGLKDKDLLTCSIDVWREIYDAEKDQCPQPELIIIEEPRRELFGLPIVSVVMIILAFVIILVGIGYYIHRKTAHEQEDTVPEELHPRVKEIIEKYETSKRKKPLDRPPEAVISRPPKLTETEDISSMTPPEEELKED